MALFEDKSKQDIKLGDSDKTLISKLNVRIDEGLSIRKKRMSDWTRNLKFFDGDHYASMGFSLPNYKSNIFINKVFAGFRSLVALETDAKPSPIVASRITEDEDNKELIIKSNKKIESALNDVWDLRQVPLILTEIYYDRYILDDGYGMYFWNTVDNDVDFEQIKPQELLRSAGSTSIKDAEFLIIEKWRNRKYFKDNFPDKIDDIKFTDRPVIDNVEEETVNDAERKNMALVYHYFEDELWIIKSGKIILSKQRNPFWEFRTSEEQEEEIKERFNGEIPEGWQPIRNHLKRPEKPIVHFKGYHLGGEFESRSLMKQIIHLNVNINKRKAQIQDILNGTGSPQWIIDPSVPEAKARQITSKPGIKIRINPGLIRKEPASSPPQFTLEDLFHTERKFDDIMGLHEISRGATPTKRITKGEAELIKESDITPIRLLVRNSEAAIIGILNGWVQLMKLFYDQPHWTGKLGQRNLETYGEDLIREEIPDNLTVTIKVGSTLPVSKETRRAQFVRDFQLGAIDLLSYLEAMDYPNPEKIYERVLKQQAAQPATPDQPSKLPKVIPLGETA